MSENDASSAVASDNQHDDLDDDDDDDNDKVIDSVVKRTVVRLLSRVGLSQLTSLIDDSGIVESLHADTIHVRVIRSTRASDDDELRQVGQSFAVLLQLLRRCTNWNDLLAADTSLSDTVARLTEHEFTLGTMGYGVHTENTIDHLASQLTVSSNCRRDTQHTQVTPMADDIDSVSVELTDGDQRTATVVTDSDTTTVTVSNSQCQQVSARDTDSQCQQVSAHDTGSQCQHVSARDTDSQCQQVSADDMSLSHDSTCSCHDDKCWCKVDQVCDNDVLQTSHHNTDAAAARQCYYGDN